MKPGLNTDERDQHANDCPRTARRAGILTGLMFLIGLIGSSSRQADPRPLELTVERAPEWNRLFQRTQNWLAADGIYSVPLDGQNVPGSRASKVLFYFGDTIWGEVEDDSVLAGWQFLNNTTGLLEGTESNPEKLHFQAGRDTSGQRRAAFVPKTPNATSDQWYWLGDGFVNRARAGTTYVFAHRMQRAGEDGGTFNFEKVGVSLLALPPDDQPPYENHRQIESPLFVPAGDDRPEVGFGAGILPNTEAAGAPNPDGYVYVYGIEGSDKGLLAARVRPTAFTNFEDWQFWNEEGWAADISEAESIVDRVSDELSITPLSDGRYLLVFQLDTISPVVAARVGEGPAGPFGPLRKLYTCPEASSDLGNLDLFCYNAKAHPALSDPGELLVSYNVNALNAGLEALSYAHKYYRPRFIRIELYGR